MADMLGLLQHLQQQLTAHTALHCFWLVGSDIVMLQFAAVLNEKKAAMRRWKAKAEELQNKLDNADDQVS